MDLETLQTLPFLPFVNGILKSRGRGSLSSVDCVTVCQMFNIV